VSYTTSQSVPFYNSRHFDNHGAGISGIGGSIYSMDSSSSNLENTAAALAARKIRFDRCGTAMIGASPPPLDFAKQWNKFVQAAKALTGQSLGTHDNEAQALTRFLKVMKKIHGSEQELQLLLFWALRDSLGDLCVPTEVDRYQEKKRKANDGSAVAKSDNGDEIPTTDGGPIMLNNCHVGFASKVSRQDVLKFPQDYGIAKSSKPDLACIVHGQGDSDASDVTAFVELKTSDSACQDYKFKLDLTSLHAPIGQ
jgi:hypothetical protein